MKLFPARALTSTVSVSLMLIVSFVTIELKCRSVLLSHYCAGGKIEKNEMGGACSLVGRGVMCVQSFGGET
jgi:hypothetical protein